MTNSRKINLSKKIAAVFMAVIMAFGIFNMASFAEESTGSVVASYTGYAGNYDITFTYTNVGSDYVVSSGANRYFYLDRDTTYLVEFSPAIGSSATIHIFSENQRDVETITVPRFTTGMPATLRTYIDISVGGLYTIMVKSDSYSANTTGTITIYKVPIISSTNN